MKINEAITLLKQLNPISIFMYGSQANKNTNSKSDYEIGVVFEEQNYISRAKIKELVPDQNYAIFPFKIEELKSCTIDTPFQKNIYIMSMTCGNAKTVFGEKIVENLVAPEVSTVDLLMDTSFNLGYALSAVRVMKEGNFVLANEMMYKSMFYATRNLIYFQTKQFVCGYNNIFKEAKKLNLPEEYQALLKLAYDLRREKINDIETSIYFKNISYINKYVIPLLQKEIV